MLVIRENGFAMSNEHPIQIADGRMRRCLPVIVLVVMAFLVAEVLPGSAPISQPLLWPFLLIIYGPGALLVRELVQRRLRGYASIVLLGAAYGLVEEGLALQSLFNPELYKAAEWGGRVFGLNSVYAEAAIVIHAVWSAAIPILLTDLLFPARRSKPYLGRFGLVITGLWYLLGVGLLALLARTSIAPGYRAPPVLLGLAALTALVLMVVALVVVPRKAPRSKFAFNAPQPWLVLLVSGVGGLIWHALVALLWRAEPQFAQWPLVMVPLLGGITLVAVMAWALRDWAAAGDWSDRHLLALASGAVVSHTLIGILIFPKTKVDLAGLIVLGLLTMVLLGLFAIRVYTRSAPAARHTAGPLRGR
jgi:hypothetical protein